MTHDKRLHNDCDGGFCPTCGLSEASQQSVPNSVVEADAAQIAKWLDSDILPQARNSGVTVGLWLFASQWETVRAALTTLKQSGQTEAELLRENFELRAQLSRVRGALNYSDETSDSDLDRLVSEHRETHSLRQMASKFGVGLGRIRGSIRRIDTHLSQGEGKLG